MDTEILALSDDELVLNTEEIFLELDKEEAEIVDFSLNEST